MNDRLAGPEGLRNLNILHAPDKDQGSGKTLEKKAAPTSQKVVVKENRPLDDNVKLNLNTTYMLGREDSRRQLQSITQGYNTIEVALGRQLNPGEKSTLSRAQLTLAYGVEPGPNKPTFLYVHNKAASGDVVVFNRGYEEKDSPGLDNLQRLKKTSRDYRPGEQDDGGVTDIEDYANTTILVPLTTETALRVEVTGSSSGGPVRAGTTSGEMELRAWEVNRKIYDALRARAIARERAVAQPVPSKESVVEKSAIPQKQTVTVEPEKPGDIPQLKLEPGKKYILGRATGDSAIQQAAEKAGYGLIEIKRQQRHGQLSREQLEVEVVSGQRGPELRVKNIGQHNVEITDTQDKPQGKLFGKNQPNQTAKREEIFPKPADVRLKCTLSSEAQLILEPGVLSDGSVSLYVYETDW